jgi:TonB family protein
MKRWPVALSLIFFTVNCSYAEDQARKEASQILKKASNLETFKIGNHPKYRHEVHFSLVRPGLAEVGGDYLLEVDSPSFWREEVNFDNYRLRRVRIRDQIWTQATHDFTPLVVEEIGIALSTTTLSMTSRHIVKRVYDDDIEGTEGRCIDFETIHENDRIENQICVRKDSGYIFYARHGSTEATFSDFSPVWSIVKPRRITIDLPDKAKIVADSTYNDIEKSDPAEFKPIDGADVSDVCEKSTSPVVKYAPDPIYPLIARLGFYKGKVTGVVKVGQDGSVLNAAVVDSVQRDLDAAALEAVKKWKFKPGTCNGKPVNSVTQFSVTFQ